MNYGKKATMQLLRKYDNKSSKVKNKFKLIVLKILLVVVIVAGAAGISSGIGVMKGIIDSAPDISKIDVTPTGYSTTVLAANGEETATLVGQGANRQYVTIDEIPLDLQHAFVAIEDERFYDHNGIDLHARGDEVLAMMEGVVVKVGQDKTSGKYVTLRHGNYTVSYCHLSKVLVGKGATVRPRDVVGVSGSTGRSTGEHLHITCKLNGKSIDPLLVLDYIKSIQEECVAALATL